MKKWMLMLLAAACLTSACGVYTETPSERQVRENREAQFVAEKVKAGDFSVDITRMYPLRGSSKSVSSYSVTVKDGKMTSHLPFVGQAWRVKYGGGNALSFDDVEISEYQVSTPRKDSYVVRVRVKTEDDDFVYVFTIFTNGNTSLDVQSVNRDRISYSGELTSSAK
jgi:hypothetical protein